MAHITELATEVLFLILAIGDGQLRCRDVASVARTCKVLCHVATPVLYYHNISHDRSSALIWAARNNRIDTIEKALVFGADVNTFGPSSPVPQPPAFHKTYGTPLHWAACQGFDDIVRLLLDHNARLDTTSLLLCQCSRDGSDANYTCDPFPQWFPLHLAICNKHKTTAHIILDRRPPMYMRHETEGLYETVPTILHCAASRGLDSVVRRALDLYPGILDTEKDENWETFLSPLHYAVDCWDSKSMIRTLVSAGCDLEAEDEERLTPIWRACEYGNFATAMHLLAEGAQTRSASEPSSGQFVPIPLLHYAVRGRAHLRGYDNLKDSNHHDEQLAFVKALIEEHGHTVHDSIDGSRNSMPLNTALEPNGNSHADASPALIRFLLEKGADPKRNDIDGLSPLFRVVQDLLSHDPLDSFDDEPEEDEDEDQEPPDSSFWKANHEEIFKDATQTLVREDIHTQWGTSLNPWLGEASEAGPTRKGMWRSPEDMKSDAWEVMTELLKFGAQLETRAEPRSPIFPVMRSAVEEPTKECSYALLKFLLENRPSKALSTRFLGELLQYCLMMSPQCGGREIVNSLLIKHGASLDYQDPIIQRDLRNAFMASDDVWLAMLCFEKSCLPDSLQQLFLEALERNSRRVARYILSKSDESIVTAVHRHTGDTPLHFAASMPDFQLSLLLIERGADVEALNSDRLSPLHEAIRSCHDQFQVPALRIACLLLDKGADPFRIHYEDDLDPTRCICDPDPDPRQEFDSPFSFAVALGRVDVLRYMLQKHQLTSQHPCIICSCILRMCIRPRLTAATSPLVIDALLKAGASPNGCGQCAHSFVACYAKELRAMLQTGLTCMNSTSKFLPLKSLIAGGADVNQSNPDGETAVTVMAEILSYRSAGKVDSAGQVDNARLAFVQEVGEFFSLKFDDAGKASIVCRLLPDTNSGVSISDDDKV